MALLLTSSISYEVIKSSIKMVMDDYDPRYLNLYKCYSFLIPFNC